MESDVLQAQMIAIGGSPQKMAFGEIYQALQTGAVDAFENTWSNIYSSKFYEVQPYFMHTNHGYVGYLVAVNAQFWQLLPEDIREGLEEIMAEVTTWGNARAAAINEDSRLKIADSQRTEILTLSGDEILSWKNRMQPVWARFSAEIGPELIEAARSTSLMEAGN